MRILRRISEGWETGTCAIRILFVFAMRNWYDMLNAMRLFSKQLTQNAFQLFCRHYIAYIVLRTHVLAACFMCPTALSCAFSRIIFLRRRPEFFFFACWCGNVRTCAPIEALVTRELNQNVSSFLLGETALLIRELCCSVNMLSSR